jgi:hypothetical protein
LLAKQSWYRSQQMPNNSPAKEKESARQLLACEAAVRHPTDAKDSAAFRVCEKLRGPLGTLMGVGGFHSLQSRALALAWAEFRWLRPLEIKADGALEGLGKLEVGLDPRSVAEGEVVLVSKLLGLLVTFIGPALTLRLLRDIWPQLKDLNL